MTRIYLDQISWKERFIRLIWNVISSLLGLIAIPILGKFRVYLLRIFGAEIGEGCKVYPTCKILKPWKLKMNNYSCLGPDSSIYNIDLITIGSNVTISQGAFLCTGSHDISYISKPLISSPITLEDNTWICAEAFVGPGVIVREGSIIGARCVIMKPTEAWSVYAGNPAIKIKNRTLKS
jgi:putative colanic acid biosynthesis acetyltransferase WcaF